MSNKRVPTEASYFVSSILRPVKAYFGIVGGGNLGQSLKRSYLESFSTSVFNQVALKYIIYLHSSCIQLTPLLDTWSI